MQLFKRKTELPGIELLTSEGIQTPLRVTFKNGEIHINADAMVCGSYQLVIKDGKNSVSRPFTIH